MFSDRRFWTLTGLYGVLLLAALPLALGWVPPNRWYGFRIPGTLHRPEAWYAINAEGGLFFAAAMVICAGLNLLIFRMAPESVVERAGWINAALILLSFWLTSLELLDLLPGG